MKARRGLGSGLYRTRTLLQSGAWQEALWGVGFAIPSLDTDARAGKLGNLLSPLQHLRKVALLGK